MPQKTKPKNHPARDYRVFAAQPSDHIGRTEGDIGRMEGASYAMAKVLERLRHLKLNATAELLSDWHFVENVLTGARRLL